MSDLAMQVSADVRQATGPLASVGKALDTVRSKAIATGAAMGRLAMRTQRDLPKAAQQAGQIGGEGGGILSRVGGVMGGAGALGRLGLIAMATGLALQAISAQAENAARAAEMLARAQMQARDAQIKASQQRDQSAQAGLQLAEQEQRVRSIGGDAAVAAMQKLGQQGVPRDQAAAGVQSAYANASPAAAQEILGMAQQLLRLGVGFGDAAAGLAKRLPRDSALIPARSNQAMSEVYGQSFGIDSPQLARQRMIAAYVNTSNILPGTTDGYQRNVQIRQARATENLFGAQNLADFGERFASMFAKQLGEARAPEAVAQLAVYTALAEQTMILQKQLEAMGAMGRALDTASSFWRGSGRAVDLANTQNAMIGLDAGPAPVARRHFAGKQ